MDFIHSIFQFGFRSDIGFRNRLSVVLNNTNIQFTSS